MRERELVSDLRAAEGRDALHVRPFAALTVAACVASVWSTACTPLDAGSDRGGEVASAGAWETVNENAAELGIPKASVKAADGMMQVSWSDASAVRYRVLALRESESPREATSVGLRADLPAEPGSYSVVVEAYDALGNSRFSDPVAIEVK